MFHTNLPTFSAARQAILAEEYNYFLQKGNCRAFYTELLNTKHDYETINIFFDIVEFLLTKSKFVAALYYIQIPLYEYDTDSQMNKVLTMLLPDKPEETLIDRAALSLVSALFNKQMTPLEGYQLFENVPEGTHC